MINTYPAAQARVNLGQLLDRVQHDNEEIIIERLGQPIAIVKPFSKNHVGIQALRARLAKYNQKLTSEKLIRTDRDRK